MLVQFRLLPTPKTLRQLDTCTCGDRRHHHNAGPCEYIMHAGRLRACLKFTLAAKAEALGPYYRSVFTYQHWGKYYEAMSRGFTSR